MNLPYRYESPPLKYSFGVTISPWLFVAVDISKSRKYESPLEWFEGGPHPNFWPSLIELCTRNIRNKKWHWRTIWVSNWRSNSLLEIFSNYLIKFLLPPLFCAPWYHFFYFLLNVPANRTEKLWLTDSSEGVDPYFSLTSNKILVGRWLDYAKRPYSYLTASYVVLPFCARKALS